MGYAYTYIRTYVKSDFQVVELSSRALVLHYLPPEISCIINTTPVQPDIRIIDFSQKYLAKFTYTFVSIIL